MMRLNLTAKRLTAALLVAVAAAFVGTTLADARVGGGKSFGSRGDRTYSAPPSTRTAPGPASPVERSITQPGKSTVAPSANLARPAVANPQSRWGSSFGGLLLGGLLGAGLFGLLSGAGLFAGLGSLAGALGFMLQVALIGGLIWLAMAMFRGRQAAMVGAGAGKGMGINMARSGLGGSGAAGAGGNRGSFAAGNQIALQQADFDAFERLLGSVQTAWSQENVQALKALATPEMVNYVLDDLAENNANGIRNEISGVRLLSGDLSEAWRERDAEYATVAMRFELIDTKVDRRTGRIVEGNAHVPTEATEIWTFRRHPGNGPTGWRLSAIQQAT